MLKKDVAYVVLYCGYYYETVAECRSLVSAKRCATHFMRTHDVYPYKVRIYAIEDLMEGFEADEIHVPYPGRDYWYKVADDTPWIDLATVCRR